MFILSNFLIAIARVLQILINAYIFVLIADAVLSFIVLPYNLSPLKQMVSVLANFTLNPLRKVFKPVGRVDYTPFLAVLFLVFINSFVVQTLLDLGMRLR